MSGGGGGGGELQGGDVRGNCNSKECKGGGGGGAKMDAAPRDPCEGFKAVLQMQRALRGFAMREVAGRGGTQGCNGKGWKGGCKCGCTKEGSKGGLQSRVAKAGCTQGLCNAGSCKAGMQHGIAIGRGARRGAKVDAQRRGPKGDCKAVLQKWGAPKGFAMEGVGRMLCNVELQ